MKKIFVFVVIILCFCLIFHPKKQEKRIEFISKFGWIVDEKSVIIENVKINSEFSPALTDYSNMLKKAGYNLENYKGKMLKKYTYRVKNHIDKYAVINIFVYRGKIAFADVVIPRLDGYMHNINEEKYKNAS